MTCMDTMLAQGNFILLLCVASAHLGLVLLQQTGQLLAVVGELNEQAELLNAGDLHAWPHIHSISDSHAEGE